MTKEKTGIHEGRSTLNHLLHRAVILLHRAVINKDETKVLDLLEKGANPNDTVPFYIFSNLDATINSFSRIDDGSVKIIYSSGEEEIKKSNVKIPLFYEAIKSKNINIINAFIDHGADVNLTISLELAMKLDNIVNLFINENNDLRLGFIAWHNIHAFNKTGIPLCEYAILTQDLETFKILCKNGAPVSSVDSRSFHGGFKDTASPLFKTSELADHLVNGNKQMVNDWLDHQDKLNIDWDNSEIASVFINRVKNLWINKENVGPLVNPEEKFSMTISLCQKRLPEKILSKLQEEPSKLETEFNDTCNKLETAIISYVEDTSSIPYEIQEPGKYLSSWMLQENATNNLAYIMLHNAEVRAFVQRIVKLKNLHLNDNITKSLKAVLDLYDTAFEFEMSEENSEHHSSFPLVTTDDVVESKVLGDNTDEPSDS